MGDVLEYLIDGTSGLSPGAVDGSIIVTGVCSIGEVGKGYLLGKSSDLDDLLGVGPLCDRLRDIFATGGQNPIVIAVPVEGLSGSYISNLRHTGTGPDAEISGVPGGNADVVVEILTGGDLGAATYQLSINGGENFGPTTTVPANGQITIATTGVTLVLTGTQVAGDLYEFAIRLEIGIITKVGTGPDLKISGTVKAAGEIILGIVKGGGRNTGTYQLSIDGDTFGVVKTIPLDGLIQVGSTGVRILIPNDEMIQGDTYSFTLNPPVPSITSVMTALEQPLSLYDVESVYIVGPSDSVDWAAMGAKADEMWNIHRPTYFRAETRLPYADEDLNDWTASMLEDRQTYAHRFVIACSAFGEVMDSTGKRINRNWAGLNAGRVMSIPVMRSAGRVIDGGISQGTLPELYTEAMQQMLEKGGLVTAKRYAGLRSAYWGDGKTLAEVTSDYQYEVVLRVVFKAVRLARIAALKSMYDEVGDPMAEGGAAGLNFLKSNIEVAVDTMVKAVPSELAAHHIVIPEGQDIVNNGVAVEMTLIGIPIIRQIKLFANYVYAGSSFDPRLK